MQYGATDELIKALNTIKIHSAGHDPTALETEISG
jgi:hypothetical protein